MIMKKYYFLGLFALAALAGCEKDDPEPVNEEEVITTLTMTLTNGSDSSVLKFQDLDGDGGNDPVITVSKALTANTEYAGAIVLLNEQESPAENITEEIEEEDDEHQFFFASTVPGLSVAYGDTDGDGNPVGLVSTVTTGDAGSGTLTVTLRHEPSKDAAGVPSGDITNAGGETDIEVTFDITVE